MSQATPTSRRIRTGALAGLLAAAVLVPAGPGRAAGCPTVQPPADITGRPAGAAFQDCSEGTVLNILPAGDAGTYNAADFAQEEATGAHRAYTQDQLAMYANLIKAAPNVAMSDLPQFYKDASFFADPASAVVETPRPGVVILRDSAHGVPHIFGRTRADVEFGSGYASAEDRLFLMDVLRHYGRGKLSSFIGPSPSDLAMDCGISMVAGYTEQELQQQVEELPRKYTTPFTYVENGHTVHTTEGRQVVADGTAYSNGVNAYIVNAIANPTLMPVEYPALQITPQPWSVRDIVATATLVQAIFAIGGGDEVDSALLYESLVKALGKDQGSRVWADLRSQNDPQAQASIGNPLGVFNYEQTPPSVDPNSLAMPLQRPASDQCDGGPLPAQTTSLGEVSVGGITIDLRDFLPPQYQKPHSSNELIVTGQHTTGGHPIAVFGPQVSYYAPEILHEIDLHGPGIDARGASFPGTEVFVELGHGVDYAWSATSASSDIIDERLEKLCDPSGGPATASSTGTVYQGRCVPMYSRTDLEAAKPSAGAANPPAFYSIRVERTGPTADAPFGRPIIGRTTAVDPGTGQVIPVAVSYQRSTFFDELGSAPAFMEWNDPDVVHDATSWQQAAGKETGTFNWTYVDAHDVAYYQSGLLPIRPASINPNFPTWGTGEYDWNNDGSKPLFEPVDLSTSDPHPRASTEASQFAGEYNATFTDGIFTNWNNKPAPGFSAADNNFSYGPVYRVQSLHDRLEALIAAKDGQIDEADVVNAMEDGGSVDLDGAQLLPAVAQLLSTQTLNAQEAAVLNVLTTWQSDTFYGQPLNGGHRRDRSGSGSYEEGNAVAIMDALYPRLAHAVLGSQLSAPGLFDGLSAVNPMLDAPRAQGSAYDGGWEGYVQRAMNVSLGTALDPNAVDWCGDSAACAATVKGALDAAISDLSATYGTGDPAAWTCSTANPAPSGSSAAPGSGQQTRTPCNPVYDDIEFNAVGVGTVPGIPWINRPTFQQVVQYQDHR